MIHVTDKKRYYELDYVYTPVRVRPPPRVLCPQEADVLDSLLAANSGLDKC